MTLLSESGVTFEVCAGECHFTLADALECIDWLERKRTDILGIEAFRFDGGRGRRMPLRDWIADFSSIIGVRAGESTWTEARWFVRRLKSKHPTADVRVVFVLSSD